MLKDKTIAFIGAGNMAEALIRGLVEQAGVPPERIGASAPRQKRLDTLQELYGVRTTTDNLEIAQWADIIVLSTKPQIFPEVLSQLAEVQAADKLFISVAAGVTTALIESRLGGSPHVLRTMPNTPALVQAGATAICKGAHASDEDTQVGKAIFEAVGITELVKEKQLDAITGLSGSGPAYVFLIIEALADAGVKVGLSRRNALRFAAQTVMGSAQLLLETDGHPGMLKDMVTSPGGTAIVGLHTLEQGGLRTTLINAVEAATNRARDLGMNSQNT